MADSKKKKLKKWKKAAKGLRAELEALKASIAAPAVKKPNPVSPLAPVGGMPELPVIDGVEFSAVAAGIKYKGRVDVMLTRLAPGTEIAGVFTKSSTRAAPVLDCQAKLGKAADGQGAAIIVNAGNANAFTGSAGQKSVDAITGAVADKLGVPASRVFSSSTGVIGQPLPHDRVTAALDALVGGLSGDGMADAARAIMTTDTFPKAAVTTVTVGGKPVKIAGIAKGSGMIAPDMATMLVYLFTDAKIGHDALQSLVSSFTDETFNSITVDSDTSTSDSLLIAATGRADAPAITDLESADGKAFAEGLHGVMMNLAHQVVRDGEGATKFIEVNVTGADSAQDARVVAMAIANSPLIKTAVAGEDPNWGRVVMAVGKSGAKADRDLLTIKFGDILVAEKGWVSPDYTEEAGAGYMKGEDIVINVDLGLGDGASTVWTCDLTKRYIEINADYRS